MAGVGEELRWEPPGPGMWFASAEHMPTPGCRLLEEILPVAATGWATGAARYGLAPNAAAFGSSNRWFFFSPGVPGPVDVDVLDRRAAATLAERPWRAAIRRWHDEVRPAVVAANRALVGTELDALDDAGLAAHVQQAIDHWTTHAPLHFDALEGAAAGGALLEATSAWGLDPRAVLEALAGSASASSSAERLLERIAAGLTTAGIPTPATLAEVAAAGGDAAAALEELLVDFGWRVVNTDLVEPTLAERPQAILTAVRAAQSGWGRRRRPEPAALDALRTQVPAVERSAFDELVADAQATYGYNDDNTTVLFALPLGIVRRAVLEVGRRLVDRGRALDPVDALEATSSELQELLAGGGPSAGELSSRAVERRAMRDVAPPPSIGAPVASPPAELGPSTRRLEAMFDAYRRAAWTRPDGRNGRAAVTVGNEAVRGRAVVAVDPIEALVRMEPGDVLVAVSTTASYNTIFPVAGAVAVQEGGLMSHPAVLARELGLTAVIGVPDLLTRVADGDLVEVDPVAGTIRVVEAAPPTGGAATT